MAVAVLDRLGLRAEQVLVVGDRLTTDIALATAAGMASALVLSGDSQVDDLDASEVRPGFLLDTIAGLLDERD
jgi:ribonucleotide monophosphatase NagD (HAD superfamily)